MDLHVILRTCSGSSVHFSEKLRFIPVPKTELILHCLKSLALSLSRAQRKHLLEIRLTVVDDHSQVNCIDGIKNILGACPFKTEFIHLAETGNNASMKFCYGLGRDSTAELLYLVEDDYLHTLSCIDEMVESFRHFKEKLPNEEVALMPVDNMFHYFDDTMFSSPIVMGPTRHWRVNYYSNWTMLLPQKSITTHWNVWEAFSGYELSKPETHEDSLLVPLFRKHIRLFTPVPTLALHVAGARYESPFSNWQKIWRDVENEWLEYRRCGDGNG